MQGKSILGAAVCTLALIGLNTAPAVAGAKPGDVPRGQVEQGVDTARSICAYSGLNDDPDEAFPFDGQVQSYGQLVKRDFKAVFPSPGIACNPNTPPMEEP
ncbi:hypothetical protein CXX84_14110 [Arthrobacter sp. AFG7.2]|jgi:hypothetical protein|uniref:hypothetical protein n=1 Tax=Arthrobacter sp. AFG7.2 TaxID=1688693 RepID=UPI000C9E9C15|nr:hypothetical protein [Arthrobacter sp. AFG7.2]PNI07770.1 hypothetical protein CXX84_14110 [Arthrobacter sp. AFG7.2]